MFLKSKRCGDRVRAIRDMGIMDLVIWNFAKPGSCIISSKINPIADTNKDEIVTVRMFELFWFFEVLRNIASRARKRPRESQPFNPHSLKKR